MPSVKVVVADTGPLLALARINGLDWLPAPFGEVLVPAAVLAECLARPDRPEGAPIRAAVDAQWLTAVPDPPPTRTGAWEQASRAPFESHLHARPGWWPTTAPPVGWHPGWPTLSSGS